MDTDTGANAADDDGLDRDDNDGKGCEVDEQADKDEPADDEVNG